MAGLEVGETGGTDEIKPFKIHVSSKYVDLTKQKLELTRLPHELSEPKSRDWWEPKPQIEPLIDFWLEQYSWRDQEQSLNEGPPQFRTSVSIPNSEAPVRLHFLHVRSPHANAVPLLLIPPFPFTNLSFGHLVQPFTDPEDVASNQPFHLVVPSLPGLGFSDALPNNTLIISTTAEILNVLMTRIGYAHYVVSNAGSASLSPAEIDWKLVDYLSVNYPSSCLGSHFIAPPLTSPHLQESPWEWAKWSVANFFQAPILGYSVDDFSALERTHTANSQGRSLTPSQFALGRACLREPNTLAYALCDSPTGLLVFVLKALRVLGPKKDFSPTEIINFTELAWLPGPEAAMRFWAHCGLHRSMEPRKVAARPKVAITVFLGNEEEGDGPNEEAKSMLPQPASNIYACPGWGNARYDVVYSSRVSGKPGLLAWERPEIIASGVRGLAKAVLAVDKRLKPSPEPVTAPLEQIVVPTEGQTTTKVALDTEGGKTGTEMSREEVKEETEVKDTKEIVDPGPSTQPGESSRQGNPADDHEQQQQKDQDIDGESDDKKPDITAVPVP